MNFFGPNRQNPFSSGQNPVCLAKISINPFLRSKSTKTTFSGQTPVLLAKIKQTPSFRSKSTKSLFLSKPSFSTQNRPELVYLGKKSTKARFLLVINHFSRSKSTKTSQNPPPSARSQYPVLIRPGVGVGAGVRPGVGAGVGVRPGGVGAGGPPP